MGRYSKKGRILRMQQNLAMKQRYVTNVVHNETKTEKPEPLEEVKMRPELEQRLENTRTGLKMIERMRREKMWILQEIQSDPNWTKSLEDKEGDSPFEDVYHHFISTEEFMISQQECPEVEKSVNSYIRMQVQTRQKAGIPVDSDEITVEVMEMMNTVYKEFLAVHMRYLEDLIERYTHKLEVKKLEKEFYSLAVMDRRKKLEREIKLRDEKREAEKRMKEQKEQEQKVEDEKEEQKKDEQNVEEVKVEEAKKEDQKAEGQKEKDEKVTEVMVEEQQEEQQNNEEQKENTEEKPVDEGEKENSPIATQ